MENRNLELYFIKHGLPVEKRTFYLGLASKTKHKNQVEDNKMEEIVKIWLSWFETDPNSAERLIRNGITLQMLTEIEFELKL